MTDSRENPHHLHGPEFDAYQMRRTAEALAALDDEDFSAAMIENVQLTRAILKRRADYWWYHENMKEHLGK